MQNFPLPKSIKSPTSPFLKGPFIRLRIIEAKDIFLNQGKRKYTGNTYATVVYGLEGCVKTHAISKASSPRWNSVWEFDYLISETEEGNVISVSIYDKDGFGSDELIATQNISLAYFKERNQFEKPIDLWLKLNNVNSDGKQGQIFVETNASLYQELNLPNFEEEIITDPKIIKDESFPKLHVALEIFNETAIKHFHVSIPEVEEFTEEGAFGCKVYVYVIKVTRNDGLEWLLRKRYSQIRKLRKDLAALSPESNIEQIPFPSKTMLKFTSKLFSGLNKDYQKVSEERRRQLEEFLRTIAADDKNYDLREFVVFFSSD